MIFAVPPCLLEHQRTLPKRGFLGGLDPPSEAIVVHTLTLQSLLFLGTNSRTPEKARIFLSAEPLKEILGKEQKRTKKQGKSQNEKSKENKKSKDWKVRVF